jgi:hypothetical protein
MANRMQIGWCVLPTKQFTRLIQTERRFSKQVGGKTLHATTSKALSGLLLFCSGLCFAVCSGGGVPSRSGHANFASFLTDLPDMYFSVSSLFGD